jgi:hypothetical protein
MADLACGKRHLPFREAQSSFGALKAENLTLLVLGSDRLSLWELFCVIF